MKTFTTTLKKYSLLLLIIIVAALAAYYFLWYKNGKVPAEILTIAPADFTQTVSVSGKVIPAKSVELGFNKSGKISQVPVIVGQRVEAGQLLAAIDSKDAVLALENAKIDLKKMQESSNLANQTDLSENDEASLAAVDNAYLNITTILDGLNAMLNNYQVSMYKNNLPSDTARDYYKKAQVSYYKARNAYDPLIADYRQLKRPLSKVEISRLAEDTYNLAQSLSQAVNDSYTFVSFVYDQTNESGRSSELTSDKGAIATWRGTMSTMIPTLSSGRNDLKDSTLNIEAQKLVIAQKENDLASYFLYSPFAGVITRLDIKTGEQAIAGQATITMINSGLLQIESFVPEIYIANLKVGNSADVTLDAYGTDIPFSANIISIDPAETIHDGVSTYKVKLQFTKEDPRIKPGMTANLFITALKKTGVISVPVGAIITRDEQKFVQVKIGEQITEKLVKTGEKGALGQTEILEGLKTGDQVILTPQVK